MSEKTTKEEFLMKEEKLVEEVLERILWVADIGLQDFQATSAVDAALERERRGLALAEELIACIGKAVLSGEYPGLDEALGVLGRVKTQGGDLLADTLATICGWDESPVLSIIALRKEEEQ